MNVKCSNCGKIDDKYKMVEFNTGRTQYMCWECYKTGHGEAHLTEIERAKRMARYEHILKRKK